MLQKYSKIYIFARIMSLGYARDYDQLALHPNYRLYDNLHPGPDGYDVMEAIIKPIIDGLL
jgi:hypothetical protein